MTRMVGKSYDWIKKDADLCFLNSFMIQSYKLLDGEENNGDHNCLIINIFRGNKGFVAMGDLNKEYYTGLPDGEYCDIIQDCQQKIQV